MCLYHVEYKYNNRKPAAFNPAWAGGLSVIHVTAVEVDDPFARAHANLAITCIYDFINKRSDESDQSLKRASYYSNRAIEVDDSLPQLHCARDFAETFNKDYIKALAEAEQAIMPLQKYHRTGSSRHCRYRILC
jgi:hypothetical protein